MTTVRGRAPDSALDRPVCAAVCSGGGVMGAYQVGVLGYIHEHFARGDRSPFEVYAGISCGSINAAFCASTSYRVGWGRRRLEHLWRSFHVPDYFERGIGGLVRSALARRLLHRLRDEARHVSALDPVHMWRLFERELDRSQLEQAFRLGTTLGLGIAAKEATRSLSTWFVDGPAAVPWQRPHAVCRRQEIGPRHVVASCSVPFYFPPVTIDDRLYFDGAVHLERPFAAAISMGATRILGITSSVVANDADRPIGRAPSSPLESLLRSMLSVFNHDFMASEVEQIRVVNRFAGCLDRRAMEPPPDGVGFNAVFDARHHPSAYVPIDVHLVSPSRSLRGLADDFRRRSPRANRRVVPVGLLFHRDFIAELIDLGYRDARGQHDTLRRFLEPTRPRAVTGLEEFAPAMRPSSGA